MTDLRLVIFDVDGTLVDSQAHIMAAMSLAFTDLDLEVPARDDVLGLVGLSLPIMMPQLAPGTRAEVHEALVEGYKSAFMRLRTENPSEQMMPMFPGAKDAIALLSCEPEILLGVATGKSRRGLDKVLESHGLTKTFVTEQVADHHPSKPHPSMLATCLVETGVDAEQAVMVGDTSFDMEMAKAAGLFAVGVSWGYHDRARLSAADVIIDEFEELQGVLNAHWG